MEEKIIENIKEQIYKSKKSITDISRKSKISRAMIYKIIKNEVSTLSLDTIESICNAINVNIDTVINNKNRENRKKIPVLGTIPAGIPIEAIENIIDYEEITEEMANKGEYFALKVKGNSMDPTITNGDIVIVKQQDDAESGKICVVMINGNDATLKEIKKETNGIWILPHNPNADFKPTFYTNKEVIEKPVKILGVAVEIRRSI